MVDKKFIMLLEEEEEVVYHTLDAYSHVFRKSSILNDYKTGRKMVIFISAKTKEQLTKILLDLNLNYVFFIGEDSEKEYYNDVDYFYYNLN